MDARAVDDAAADLRELRHEEWGQLAVGAFALTLAVAATEGRPQLALPLFLGGLVVGALGLRTLWRRWDLVDRLAGEPDAYLIPEVLAYAVREATLERRRSFAVLIRDCLGAARPRLEAGTAEELEALAAELEDDRLVLAPASAVACSRLLSDLDCNPLRAPMLPQAELEFRSRVRRIRSGFGRPNQ